MPFSVLSFKAFILIDVLFLVVSICYLYVCLCVVLAMSRRELFLDAEDQKVMTKS